MLFLQIRQAEVALAGGRLDEAYRLLQSDDLRSHRRGQALIGQLVKKLVSRATKHFEANYSMQALLDCHKAEQLGGNQSEVIALRLEIEKAAAESDRAQREKARTDMMAQAGDRVESAWAKLDLDRAVAELTAAKAQGTRDSRLRDLDNQVRISLQQRIEESLNKGRLDQIESLLDRLTRLDPNGLATQTLARLYNQVCEGWDAIANGNPSSACEALHRLRQQLPDAAWVQEAIEHTETADRSLRLIRSGPLGTLNMEPRKPQKNPANAVRQTARDAKAPAEGSLPKKFILQVDGVGSYLVLRQPLVTVGSISSSPAPDIALLAEAGAPVMSIERMDDDYFLRVGGVGGKLLSSGMRLDLSPRCSLIFNHPNPASTSAALDLSSGRFPRADIRRVILMDRDLIIGPGNAHITVDGLPESIVLQVRDGKLWAGKQELAIGTPVNLAGVSMVATA